MGERIRLAPKVEDIRKGQDDFNFALIDLRKCVGDDALVKDLYRGDLTNFDVPPVSNSTSDEAEIQGHLQEVIRKFLEQQSRLTFRPSWS